MAIKEENGQTNGNGNGAPAAGFVNYGVVMKDGVKRANRGFPISGNPAYRDKMQNQLLELAQKNGGKVNVTLKAQVVLNGTSDDDLSIDDFIVDDDPFA